VPASSGRSGIREEYRDAITYKKMYMTKVRFIKALDINNNHNQHNIPGGVRRPSLEREERHQRRLP